VCRILLGLTLPALLHASPHRAGQSHSNGDGTDGSEGGSPGGEAGLLGGGGGNGCALGVGAAGQKRVESAIGCCHRQ
jgi:hypothetical protein